MLNITSTIRTIEDMLDFTLPPELEASEPPEARGLARDAVALMVSSLADDRVDHTRFREVGNILRPGDVLVVNTSGTLNAALDAVRDEDEARFELHLSTRLPADIWAVELRLPSITSKGSTAPYYEARPGQRYILPGGASATLLAAYNPQDRQTPGRSRLWLATLEIPGSLTDYLDTYGFPIRYSYVKAGWPNAYYQTVYATEAGSAEMPSAGRAFTAELMTRLVARGVQIAPLLLHTGVASLEDHEPPYEEYYRVSSHTARLINTARANGGRIIAVGTTSVRALETVTDEHGVVHPGEGWTTLVITPTRKMRAVDGLLTGLHEPRATHLAMLESLVRTQGSGRAHLRRAYAEALERGYLWHEFGDLHLILP